MAVAIPPAVLLVPMSCMALLLLLPQAHAGPTMVMEQLVGRALCLQECCIQGCMATEGHPAVLPCPPFIPHLSWVARVAISVIPPVLSHLANSNPVFPGVSFLMELEIIWALFARVLAVGVMDGGSGVGLPSMHAPSHCTPKPPMLRGAHTYSSMCSYFSVPRRKGLLGFDPSNIPLSAQKVRRVGCRRAAGGGRGELPSIVIENAAKNKNWEKNNSNKHFMKQKMAYKEVNF